MALVVRLMSGSREKDDTRIAVDRIIDNGEPVRTRVFDQLMSHYLFCDRFARVAQINVEGLVKYHQLPILTPIPEAADCN